MDFHIRTNRDLQGSGGGALAFLIQLPFSLPRVEYRCKLAVSRAALLTNAAHAGKVSLLWVGIDPRRAVDVAKQESAIVVYAALACNALIAATKFGAAAFTGSAAMMSEGIHSIVDTGNQLFLLLGIRRASQRASATHPFGYGLQLYVWAFVVAIIMFGLGACVSVAQGIEKLRFPHPVEHPVVNYVVLSLAILFESAAWSVALRRLREEFRGENFFISVHRSKDPTVFTVLLEDSAAMVGLVIALIGLVLAQWLAIPAFDGIASILIGIVLGVTAIFLAAESQSLLTGEAVEPAVRENIERIARSDHAVQGVNELLTMHFGPEEVLAALSLDFVDDVPAGEVERAVTRIERAIKEAHPEVKRVFVEAQSRDAHRDELSR
jgi:cation diffusion facilitator family transporter